MSDQEPGIAVIVERIASLRTELNLHFSKISESLKEHREDFKDHKDQDDRNFKDVHAVLQPVIDAATKYREILLDGNGSEPLVKRVVALEEEYRSSLGEKEKGKWKVIETALKYVGPVLAAGLLSYVGGRAAHSTEKAPVQIEQGVKK